MVAVSSAAEPTPTPIPTIVRPIGIADLHWALRCGWEDYRARRGDLLLIGLIYPVVILVVAAIALNVELFPLLMPIAGGLALLGPLLAVGFYELARRREEGRESDWSHFLDPFRGPSRGSILVLGTVLAGFFCAWMWVAWQIYEVTVGRLNPPGLDGFVTALFTAPEGWMLIVIGNLVGLVFAMVALTCGVVSFPMLVDKPVEATTAVDASLKVTRRNPLTVAIWGFYIAALLAIACIPAFVGLAIALPVLGYASWHLYDRAVER